MYEALHHSVREEGSEVQTHPLPRGSGAARFPDLSSQAGQARVAHQTSGPRGPGGTRKTWISLEQNKRQLLGGQHST